jgi:hypothetical protein
MSDRTPCLGDFGGPLTEACAEGNYDIAIEIMQTYLEQCYDDDPAGASWRRYYQIAAIRAIQEQSTNVQQIDLGMERFDDESRIILRAFKGDSEGWAYYACAHDDNNVLRVWEVNPSTMEPTHGYPPEITPPQSARRPEPCAPDELLFPFPSEERDGTITNPFTIRELTEHIPFETAPTVDTTE